MENVVCVAVGLLKAGMMWCEGCETKGMSVCIVMSGNGILVCLLRKLEGNCSVYVGNVAESPTIYMYRFRFIAIICFSIIVCNMF